MHSARLDVLETEERVTVICMTQIRTLRLDVTHLLTQAQVILASVRNTHTHSLFRMRMRTRTRAEREQNESGMKQKKRRVGMRVRVIIRERS